MYDSVLIATDGSDEANNGVRYGLDLAEKTGATVHALYVVGTKASYILTVGISDQELESYREYGEDVVTAVVDEARDRGLDARGAVRTGRPSEEIVEYANDQGIDAIVMGKRGHGAVESQLGSTPEKVIWSANVPVTVVADD